MSESPVPASSRFAGIVTTAELLRSGITRTRIRTLSRRGDLISLGRGVHAPAVLAAAERAHGPAGDHLLLVAAMLAWAGDQPAAGRRPGARVPARLAASHRSAAIIHGLDLLEPAPRPVEVTQPPGQTAGKGRLPGLVVHVAALPARHVTTCRGVPVTSAARTVADLARRGSLRAGVVVADSALRSGQVSRADLLAVLSACPRWPGLQRARRAVAASDGRSESALESLSRVVFAEHGLPPPALQVWVGGGEVIGRADFLWREYRTIAEADGALKYADPVRAREQLWRDARLREAGFEVVHFTWDEIARTPGQVVAAITVAFGRGAVLAAHAAAPAGARAAAAGPAGARAAAAAGRHAAAVVRGQG